MAMVAAVAAMASAALKLARERAERAPAVPRRKKAPVERRGPRARVGKLLAAVGEATATTPLNRLKRKRTALRKRRRKRKPTVKLPLHRRWSRSAAIAPHKRQKRRRQNVSVKQRRKRKPTVRRKPLGKQQSGSSGNKIWRGRWKSSSVRKIGLAPLLLPVSPHHPQLLWMNFLDCLRQ